MGKKGGRVFFFFFFSLRHDDHFRKRAKVVVWEEREREKKNCVVRGMKQGLKEFECVVLRRRKKEGRKSGMRERERGNKCVGLG